jgi:hypothetical protein
MKVTHYVSLTGAFGERDQTQEHEEGVFLIPKIMFNFNDDVKQSDMGSCHGGGGGVRGSGHLPVSNPVSPKHEAGMYCHQKLLATPSYISRDNCVSKVVGVYTL